MNKYTGEVSIKIGDKHCNVVFDWRAIAAFQTQFGKDANLNDFTLEQLADTLLIGLKKHNPELTKDFLFDHSPPVTEISDCLVKAFIYAQHGPEQGQKIIDEAEKIVVDAKKKSMTK